MQNLSSAAVVIGALRVNSNYHTSISLYKIAFLNKSYFKQRGTGRQACRIELTALGTLVSRSYHLNDPDGPIFNHHCLLFSIDQPGTF